jgi:LysM repeat protein
MVDVKAVAASLTLALALTASPAHAEQPQRTTSYTVRPGDTLSEIADRFHISTADLMEANGIDDPRALREGQELVIP